MLATSWRSSLLRTTTGLIAAVALEGPVWTVAQQQTSARGDWPCGARLDPSYFQVAEGSGGHPLTFQRVHAPLFSPMR